jgi:hypothetical protein
MVNKGRFFYKDNTPHWYYHDEHETIKEYLCRKVRHRIKRDTLLEWLEYERQFIRQAEPTC